MNDKEITLKQYESVMQAIQSAINNCFWLNGGSIVAILTFVGNYKGDDLIIEKLSSALIALVVGVFLATLSSIVLYMAQLSYFKSSTGTGYPFFLSGTKLRLIVLGAVILSIGLFAYGAVSAVLAIL